MRQLSKDNTLFLTKKKTKNSYYGGDIKAGPFNASEATYEAIKEDAVRKFSLEYATFPRHRNWVITYDDGRRANITPSGETFTLLKYQQEICKPYSKITLYIVDNGRCIACVF
jgi:hypothetical protein